jgi:hypothetical protein
MVPVMPAANLGPDYTTQEESMTDLLKINVNEHTEKKNGLTYLSWAWAWAEVLKVDPKARWEVRTFNGYPACAMNETAMVCVEAVIGGMARECWLPVMDHRNKAIKNPDAFAINTAIMRCLAKAIAMHGLGLYIYAGEDLPEGAEPERMDGLSTERVDELESMAADMLALQEEGRANAAVDAYYGLPSNEEKLCLWGFLKGPGGGSTPESRLRALIKANQQPQKEAA